MYMSMITNIRCQMREQYIRRPIRPIRHRKLANRYERNFPIMARIDSVSEIKRQPAPGKAAIIASLLFPFIGIACILAPEGIMNFLPYLLGGLMLVVGAADLTTDLTDPNKEAGSISQGSDVVMIVVGGMLLVKGAALLTLVGVVWGFIGLSKAAGEIDETFHAIRAKAPFALLALSSAIEVVLGTLLIASPLENIEHHVLLLGIELILHPFTIHSDNGKTHLSAEA